MQIFINDRETIVPDNSSLRDILSGNNIPLVNIAVAINNTVIPKTAWDVTTVGDGCRIVVIKAVQGG